MLRNPLRSLISLFVIISGLLVAPATGQDLVDGIAAVVEGEIILMSDVQQYAMMQAYQMDINPYQQPQEFQRTLQQLQPQVLQSLIDQNIIKAKAEEDSVIIKEHEIEQALQQQIDNMVAQVGSEEALEEQLDMSIREIKDEYRDEVHKRLLVERYQQTKFANISVSRREVEKFYKTYKDSIPEMPKRAHVSHIVIKTQPGTSADSLAVSQLRDIKSKIQEGASFTQLAQQYSQDPGSRRQGGDLGFVSRGSLVPEFEQVAFSLQQGEVSDIIETEFGYHIIKLEERRGEKVHVRHILITPQATQRDNQAVIDTLNTIRNKLLAGAPFDSLALQYSQDSDVQSNRGNLGWIELPNFQIPEFRQVVDTMKVGQISEPFQTQLGLHIVKLNDVREGGEVTLKSNWPEIEQMVLQQKMTEEYQRWLESLRSNFYVDVKIQNF